MDPKRVSAVPPSQQLPHRGCCSLLIGSQERSRPFPMPLCLWLPFFSGPYIRPGHIWFLKNHLWTHFLVTILVTYLVLFFRFGYIVRELTPSWLDSM